MNFKRARENAGLTVLQASRALEVSPVAVYKWEDGRSAPSSQRLPHIAELYGCTVDDLLADTSTGA